MTKKTKPQFALRIAIGLALMLAIVEAVTHFLHGSTDIRMPIAAAVGVVAAPIILYFKDTLRRVRN